MGKKEIDKKNCPECDSIFKLMYDLDETSGFPKFCPFCAASIYDEDQEYKIAEGDWS